MMAHVTARTNTMGSAANTVHRRTAIGKTGDDGASVTHTAAIRGCRSDTAPRRQRRAEEMNATATRQRRDPANASATMAAPCGRTTRVIARVSSMGSVASTAACGPARGAAGDDGANVTEAAAVLGCSHVTAPRTPLRRAVVRTAKVTRNRRSLATACAKMAVC